MLCWIVLIALAAELTSVIALATSSLYVAEVLAERPVASTTAVASVFSIVVTTERCITAFCRSWPSVEVESNVVVEANAAISVCHSLNSLPTLTRWVFASLLTCGSFNENTN